MDENGEKHETYGVRYEGGLVEDVSFSCEKLSELIEYMNELELDPAHVMDVLSDFMK